MVVLCIAPYNMSYGFACAFGGAFSAFYIMLPPSSLDSNLDFMSCASACNSLQFHLQVANVIVDHCLLLHVQKIVNR